jgi:hypothetical protein
MMEAKKLRIKPEEVEKIRQILEKARELKEALEQEERPENPGYKEGDILLALLYLQLEGLGGKMEGLGGKVSWLSGWLLGIAAVTIGLLVAIAVAVF